MIRTILKCAAIGLAFGAASPALARGERAAADAPVLVIPARYAFVKAAMDVEVIRPIPIVCYGVGTNAMALNRWNASTKVWDPMTMEDLKAGVGLGRPPVAAIMGTEMATVASLAEMTKGWAGKAAHIPSCDLVSLVNTLNASLHFTNSEWKWLADRFGLTLKDENEQRRRYGRYGPPDQKKGPPPPKAPPVSDVVMPKAATDVVIPKPAASDVVTPKVAVPEAAPAAADEPKDKAPAPSTAPATEKPAEPPAKPAAGQ